MKIPKKLDEAPKGEWFLLDGKEGRFYTVQRRILTAPSSALCVDQEGYPIAEMWINTYAGTSFTTYTPLSKIAVLTVFNVLKGEVPKP